MIAQADALHIPLAPQSVHCVVTSPPYWGLRAYATGDAKALELGAERVPDCLGWATGAPCGECYVCHMVHVGRELWRVLRDDGVLFLNLGDSYASAWACHRRSVVGAGSPAIDDRANMLQGALKEKDLCGIPWRVALALQADGWYLRSDIIWAKPNPMPESMSDRPTKAHEYIFLLSKRERYYYDAEAVKENCESGPSDVRKMIEGLDRIGGKHQAAHDPLLAASASTHIGQKRAVGSPAGRNRRSVWTIATSPYSGAHYAVFPPALVEPMILAGTSARGCCPACGAPWVRVTAGAKYEPPEVPVGVRDVDASRGDKTRKLDGKSAAWRQAAASRVTAGWRPACACPAADPVPAVVLDPFCGSGTTGQVARLHGRRFVGLDISTVYLRDHALARAENTNAPSAYAALPLFATAAADAGAQPPATGAGRDGDGGA